jgi:hypothetical protein
MWLRGRGRKTNLDLVTRGTPQPCRGEDKRLAVVSAAPSDGVAVGAPPYDGDSPLLPKFCIRPSRSKHIGHPMPVDVAHSYFDPQKVANIKM